jgi:hypothetical protein
VGNHSPASAKAGRQSGHARIRDLRLATPEAKGALGLLLNNPAFFPFQLPVMTGDFVSQRSDRIDVVRYGLDDELLKLKGN